MRILLTAEHSIQNSAVKQSLLDASLISSRHNFSTHVVKKGKFPHLWTYLKILFNNKDIDVVLVVYPTVCNPLIFYRFLDYLFIRYISHNKIMMLYVLDLPIEQYKARGLREPLDIKSYKNEGRVISLFDKIFVFNDAMISYFVNNYNINIDVFNKFEMLDYTVLQPNQTFPKIILPYQIAYSGEISEKIINEFNEFSMKFPQVNLNLYGKYDDGQKLSNNLNYRGIYSPSEIVWEMSKYNHFGLITRGSDESWTDYHRFTSTSKFSAYMVSGLPVLVPRKYLYISELVKKFDVGVTFDNLDEIPFIIDNISQLDYERMRSNAFKLGTRLSEGKYLDGVIHASLNE